MKFSKSWSFPACFHDTRSRLAIRTRADVDILRAAGRMVFLGWERAKLGLLETAPSFFFFFDIFHRLAVSPEFSPYAFPAVYRDFSGRTHFRATRKFGLLEWALNRLPERNFPKLGRSLRVFAIRVPGCLSGLERTRPYTGQRVDLFSRTLNV